MKEGVRYKGRGWILGRIGELDEGRMEYREGMREGVGKE